ncbi:fermitin family homolog 2-like isoform X2 [Corticium candelabrum]|uniref:fermitin family homolog 2-like isoform X2 n=1 Tax=Corticium candelabrum TaxID=121492 RepID=UPI002E25BE1C|nr:fermitin family homolog 2-like isoform X2 [Corticium candelabrum]
MSISVKVTIDGVGETCLVQVKSFESVAAVINGLKKPSCEINGQSKKPVKMGLYWPDKKRWLDDGSLVCDTEIKDGTILELKSRQQIVRIRFLDGSSKMLWIDSANPVRQVVSEICEELGMTWADEMSLVVAGDYSFTGRSPKPVSPCYQGSLSPSRARQLLGSQRRMTLETPSPPASPKSPSQRRRLLALDSDQKNESPLTPKSSMSLSRLSVSRSRSPSLSPLPSPSLSPSVKSWSPNFLFRKKPTVKKQISRRHQLRLDTPWLDPNKTLLEQDVEEDDELILMFRFFYNNTLTKGSREVAMLYSQAKAAFLNGEIACSCEVTSKFAALELQIRQGNCQEPFTDESIVAVKPPVIPKRAGIKEFSPVILSHYKQLYDVSATDAIAMFVQLWSTLPTFGIEFLSCAEMSSKRKGLVGVSKDKIVFIDHDTKKLTLSWPFSSLVKWTHDPQTSIVVLSFPSTELCVLIPGYSDVLSDCLSEHKRLHDIFASEMESLDPDPASHYIIMTDSGLSLETFSTTTNSTTDRTNVLSFHDMFWAADIANPLVSSEELDEMKKGSWENPAFADIQQVVEDRFAFLDKALESCLDDNNENN